MRILLTSITLCSILSFAHIAQAQFGGSTSSFGGASGLSGLSGMSSSGSRSSTSSSGFGGSSSGFGSSSGGSSSRSTSGMFGSRQLGNSQSTRKQNTPGDMGTAGQTSGTERFMRQNRQPGQFVGSDRSDAFMGTGDATSEVQALQGMRMARSMQQNINEALSRQMNGGNNTKKRTIRTIKAVDFPYAGPPPAVISDELTNNLIKVDATHQIGLGSGFKVEMAGRTAILRGNVRDERAKALAEKMLLLEPGVSSVQNELNYPEVIPATTK